MLRDAAHSLMPGLDARDEARPARDSIEDRTGAAVMRSDGIPEAEIARLYGYSPTPIARTRPTIDDVRAIIAAALARARRTMPASTSEDAIADVVLRDLRAAGIRLVHRPRSE